MIPIFLSCGTTELPAIVSSVPRHDVTSFVKFHLCNRAPRLFHYLKISVLPAPKQRGGGLCLHSVYKKPLRESVPEQLG